MAAGLGIMEVCSSNEMGAPNASHLEQETTQPNRPKQTKISPGKRARVQERHWAHFVSAIRLSKMCIPDQPNHSFQPYAVYIEEMNSRSEGRCSGLVDISLTRYSNSSRMVNANCRMDVTVPLPCSSARVRE